MQVYLYSPALRAKYGAGAEPVDVPDDVAVGYLNAGVAGPVKARPTAETADARPDLEGLSKAELVAEAERRGIQVRRADGKDGPPLKDDYIRALG